MLFNAPLPLQIVAGAADFCIIGAVIARYGNQNPKAALKWFLGAVVLFAFNLLQIFTFYK